MRPTRLLGLLALIDQPQVDLERTTQDLGVAPAELERFVHAGEIHDGEATDELFRLNERPVDHSQIVAVEEQAPRRARPPLVYCVFRAS